MRAGWILIAGAVVSGVTACGGQDNAELFGSGGKGGASTGGSNAGGSSAGGTQASGGSGNAGGSAGIGGSPSGGAAGAGAGGVPVGGAAGAGGTAAGGAGGTAAGGAGGTAAGGAGGTAAGGAGGTAAGGAGGTAAGGSGGTTAGGSGGTMSGGSGGTTAGGTGGVATGGTGGCTTKVWCKDEDGDTYGRPTGLVYNCNQPSGGNWIQMGSKAEACGDCADQVKDAYPFSNFCGSAGYATALGTSFDYNCDTQENSCATLVKAGVCGIDPNDSTKCLGAGYLPVPGSTAKNKYCGSTQWQTCTPVSITPDAGGTLACTPGVATANHVTCK